MVQYSGASVEWTGVAREGRCLKGARGANPEINGASSTCRGIRVKGAACHLGIRELQENGSSPAGSIIHIPDRAVRLEIDVVESRLGGSTVRVGVDGPRVPADVRLERASRERWRCVLATDVECPASGQRHVPVDEHEVLEGNGERPGIVEAFTHPEVAPAGRRSLV